MFRKLLVANRGEIAIRAFRAAYELDLATVAVFPYEDRNSLHRAKADESYLIGERGHPVRAYLSVDEVIGAARHLIAHPDADLEALMRFVPGPDLPLGGRIVGLDGIREAYESGRGSFRTRATARIAFSVTSSIPCVAMPLPLPTFRGEWIGWNLLLFR